MKETIISKILQSMLNILNNDQLKKLQDVLNYVLIDKEIIESNPKETLLNDNDNNYYIDLFLSAKQLEGCSSRTIKYYRTTLINVFQLIEKSVTTITTEDLRKFLTEYENNSKANKVTLDNIRRIISSFYSWLENENYILKSPSRRIRKIKSCKTVKNIFSDEDLELMRDNISNPRDLAIIDLLSSTGIRVGELVKIDISDIDFDKRELIVLGKGNKERTVYFDARTKIHLKDYIKSRSDNNTALFVSLNKPYNRLKISAVEIRIRQLGKYVKIDKAHPHKFRRTLATKAIDKGMPIEQVQVLLGHTKIDTTLQYAMVNQNNVKIAHQKYIA